MIFVFEMISDKVTEADRSRGRRVAEVVSVLDDDWYLVSLTGYERTPKVPSRVMEKFKVGDIVKLEPVGFNNRLEITGRTGSKRYSQSLLQKQIEDLMASGIKQASDISYDDTLLGLGKDDVQEVLEHLSSRDAETIQYDDTYGVGVDNVQDIIDNLVQRVVDLETIVDSQGVMIADLDSRVSALE